MGPPRRFSPSGILVRCAALFCVACGLLAGAPSPASPQAAIPTLEATDSLLLQAWDMDGAYAALVRRMEALPHDPETLWRMARVALGLGIMGADADTRLRWLRTADDHGRALLAVRPDDVEALAWAAATRGRRAIAEDGPRTVAGLARDTWEITERLLAVEPDHPLGNHVRGKLHQEVVRLPGWRKLFARLFLGSDLVNQASWQGAEGHFQRALAADPGMVLFHLDLGETFRLQEKWSEAEAAYLRGLATPDRLPVDARFKRVLRERLAQVREEGGTP